MGCKAPILGAKSAEGFVRILPRSARPTPLTIKKQSDRWIEIPCGHCMQCRVAQARDWSIRCTHEAQMHRHEDGSPNGCFITLTFDNDGLALRELRHGTHPLSLSLRDWQLFAKKLRQHMVRMQRKRERELGLNKKPPARFRFFQVGEYGDDQLRPHYHALIFGYDFSEDRIQCRDETGKTYFKSPSLDKIWSYGLTDIRPITTETVNYVCKYVTKKMTGPRKDSWLDRIDAQTGELVRVYPEFATMSRNPGLGARWYDKFKNDVYPDNFVVLKGKQKPVPKYYNRRLKQQDPELHQVVNAKAQEEAKKRIGETTPERRQVKEKIARANQRATRRAKLD